MEQRYYEKSLPDLHELVMVRIKSLTETSAKVHLLEYGNVEGLMPYTEVTRLRVRSMSQFVKVNKTEVVQVIRIDKERGYIDLGKKTVLRKDVKECKARFNKAKLVMSTMRRVGELTNTSLADMMKLVAWPLYNEYGHAFVALKAAAKEPDVAFRCLQDKVDEAILSCLKKRCAEFRDQPKRLRADMDITCYTSEGVDCIRDGLLRMEAFGSISPVLPLTVHVIAPPKYMVQCNAEDADVGIKKLLDAIDHAKAYIDSRGGTLVVTAPPSVVGEEAVSSSPSSSDDE